MSGKDEIPEKMKRTSHMYPKEPDNIEDNSAGMRRHISILENVVENVQRRRGAPLGCVNCHAHVDNVELSGLTKDYNNNSLTYAYTCSECGDVFRLEISLGTLTIYGNDFTRTFERRLRNGGIVE